MAQQFTARPLVIAPSILAADFARLGEEVRAKVREKFGVQLEWEIKRIGRESAP